MQRTYADLERASMNGSISDDANPIFLLTGAQSSMLADIVAGRIDIVEIAGILLAARKASTPEDARIVRRIKDTVVLTSGDGAR